MRKLSLSSFFSTDEGAIAPLYALALFALVGMAGIGFDYARLVSLDSELQNAADQAALAAATQLDKEPGAISRAIDAAQGGLVANETLLANDGGARAIGVPTVTFFTTRADAEANTNGYNAIDDTDLDASAAFVRVAVDFRTANYALTPIVDALSGTIDAKAVAGMGSALCRSPPVMICNPNEPSGNTDHNYDFDADSHKGDGLLVALGGGGSWAPGNFGYLDTGIGNGAPGVRSALGWISPPGNCVSQNGDDVVVDTEPGNMTSVTQALNTRFDIYDTQGCESGGLCPASINSRKDLVRAANASGNNACRIQAQGWGQVAAGGRYLPTSPTVPLAVATTPTSMGHPRDMCHAVATGGCTSSAFGDGLWDRDAYFRSHYLRTSAGAGGAAGTRWNAARWWVNTGLATNATNALDVTRYDVYLWEIEHRGQTIDGVVILGRDPPSATGSTLVKHGTPVCSQLQTPNYGTGTVPSDTIADRRRISVAVINCRAEGVRGNSTDVPVRRWMDVFLVQPSANRDRTSADQIYVEVIGETLGGSSGETAGQVVRRDVPFLIK
jgi:Flp pilus assembly protein TadG